MLLTEGQDGSAVPEPPVGSDVDLKSFPYTPIFRARLFGSEFHALASDAGWRAGVTLWLKSWDQVPAGSLPIDEVSLCRLAELGRDLKTWRKVASEALHGWEKCSDGRLYHAVVAEGVNEAWQSKCAQRDRTEAARTARAAKRQSQPLSQPLSQSLSQSAEASVTDTVTVPVTASNRTEQNREEEKITLPGDPKEPPGVSVRGTRLPREFEIPQDWLEKGAAARLRGGLPPADLAIEAMKFTSYWWSKSGREATKVDWEQTWIGWCLRARALPITPQRDGVPPLSPVNGDGDALWRGRLELWRTRRSWHPEIWGEEPGKPGCQVPAHLLAEARTEAQRGAA